jgi:hypothetical protein
VHAQTLVPWQSCVTALPPPALSPNVLRSRNGSGQRSDGDRLRDDFCFRVLLAHRHEQFHHHRLPLRGPCEIFGPVAGGD